MRKSIVPSITSVAMKLDHVTPHAKVAPPPFGLLHHSWHGKDVNKQITNIKE